MSLDTGATIMADDKVHWAYVVGGQPSQNKQVQLKLYKLGINIAGYADADKRVLDNLPKITTLVVILTDQAPHTLTGKARELAEKQDLPVVAGMFRNWSEMETRIKSRNFSGPAIEPPVGQFPVKQFGTKLGDVLGDKLKPPAPPVQEEKNVMKDLPPTPIKRGSNAKAAMKQEIAKKILIENKGFILNDQIQTLMLGSVGERISPVFIRDVRKILKLPNPPRGANAHNWVKAGREKIGLPPINIEVTAPDHIREKREKKKNTPDITSKPVEAPKTKKEPSAPKEEQTRIGQEFDEIFLPVTRPKLEEWQLKHHVGKLYIAWENGEWQVNWEFIKIESGGRTYSRKDKK